MIEYGYYDIDRGCTLGKGIDPTERSRTKLDTTRRSRRTFAGHIPESSVSVLLFSGPYSSGFGSSFFVGGPN